jgi:hypothetical protein
MKRPLYYLLKDFQIRNGVVVKAFTEIHPIWNELFLPVHMKEQLAERSKMSYNSNKLVMCMIGTEWFPLEWDKIGVR